MKKILFLLLTLVSAYSYAQADFPEGVQISGGQPTVTNDPYLTTTGSTGVQGKITPVNVLIPYTPINYTISGQTIGQQIAAIDAKIGTMGTTSAGVTQRVYFTADNTVVNAITYFASSLSGKGSTASGSPPALVLPDNTKGYFNKDLISIAQPVPTIGYAGTYSGNLTVSATPTPVATQQRFTIEIYRTDNGGTPIASGVSGAPTGDLGVTVLSILDSGIINLTAGSITNIAVSGVLTQNITLNTGERLRYHVSAAKIGSGGGNVTFGVYYGTSYNSYYDIPVAITTDAVLDRSDVPGAVTATDAFNYLKNTQDSKQFKNPIYFKGKDIHWFGDSYTQGSGASPTSNRFTTIVSNALGANEINHGVAGTTMQKRVPIDYMASPNMVDNVVNIPTKTASKAMLVFAFGLNDMGQTAPDYNVTNYKTDYQFVINNALSKGWLPNQILIIPAYYIGSAGYSAYATITGNPAPDVNRHLAFIQAAKEVAETNGTMYFDVYQDQKKNDITLLDPDNIHPNNAGYAYIAFDVLQYLGADKLIAKNSSSYDLQAGFIQNLTNKNQLANSLVYDTGSRIGIATTSPQSTFHINSVIDNNAFRMTNTASGVSDLDGMVLELDSSLNVNFKNLENGDINIFTNSLKRATYLKNGRYIFNTDTDNGVNDFQVNGSISSNGLAIGTTILNTQIPIHLHASGANFTYQQFTNGSTGQASNDGVLFGIADNTEFNLYNWENAAMNLATNGIVRQTISGAGVINFSNLSGSGVRTVVADASGNLSASDAVVTGVKRYKALISQTGTSAPTVIVLENSLGFTPVWTRTAIGAYEGSMPGIAPDKTIRLISGETNDDYTFGISMGTLGGSHLKVTTRLAGVPTDSLLNKTSIIVEVYP